MTMIDIHAPIIPGESIAGISLGQPIEEVLASSEIPFHTEEIQSIGPTDLLKYVSNDVVFWAKDGIIYHIMARNHYAGKLFDKVGIGTPLAQINTLLGTVKEDIVDNLVIEGIWGLCFEIDVDSPISPVTEIAVYHKELDEQNVHYNV